MTGETLFNEAVTKGIDNEAIMVTISDLLDKLNSNEVTKEIFKEAMDIIVFIKGNSDMKTNIEFSSNYLRNNGTKIIDAFERGMSSLEISQSVNSIDPSLKNDIINFIALMKENEVKLKEKEEQKENKEAFQKILVNPNENK
jgi:uncharacterized LabA/DUF88 family protein